MKHLYSLVGACLGASLLAACGGNSFTNSTPAAAPSPLLTSLLTAPREGSPHESSWRLKRKKVVYKAIYSFGSVPDAQGPVAGLIDVGGVLYGTTSSGGANNCSGVGCGAVFAITTSGKESVLYSFAGGSDGAKPLAALTNVGDKLYGTTQMGGQSGYGTVFKVTTSGKEKVLHSFGGGSDGVYPVADLINVRGTLYGTTRFGGSGNAGTVFKITTSGKEKVLYTFGSRTGDGEDPYAGLIDVGGTLYGTTEIGGANNCSGVGCGTVFAITTSGKERVLYSFAGGSDGDFPLAGLINVGGMLYGTTWYGGGASRRCYYDGCGTIFKTTTSGMETVLYRFKGGSDGENPYDGLINAGSKLYGTTIGGGRKDYGTVFKITISGAYSQLQSLADGDGARPQAGLINVNGTLYGTTQFGGSNSEGAVFSLTP